MTGACITCGRPLKKRTNDVIVWPYSDDTSASYRNANFRADLRTIDDCRRHTNKPHIVSLKKNRHGLVIRFTTWDGESYRNRFFCTNRCAIRQANASAITGQRFSWNGRFFTLIQHGD